eukprot:gene12038-15143_t
MLAMNEAEDMSSQVVVSDAVQASKQIEKVVGDAGATSGKMSKDDFYDCINENACAEVRESLENPRHQGPEQSIHGVPESMPMPGVPLGELQCGLKTARDATGTVSHHVPVTPPSY